MARFFSTELEGVANFWRIFRSDGVTLGFTSHDRDLVFSGIRHRAAPGVVPSAIRRTTSLNSDSAEAQGALSHDSISENDMAAGLFDDAYVEIGAVDWETLTETVLYAGTIGNVEQHHNKFSAELRSAKSELERDLVPRTSPTCRASFCGPGCNLSAIQHTAEMAVGAIDWDRNSVSFAGIVAADYLDGEVRFQDGPQTGIVFGVVETEDGALILDKPLDLALQPGTMARLRAGCDHTLTTCAERFGNSINFRGEPYLPGNDLIARYPAPK